jgi:PAT family beta-lactamase induction signal transducer AmpG
VSLAERRWLRLFTLCVLYLAQGMPWGFMAITLPTYLASRGLDASATGAALAMTTLPYSFKWAWGPIIDAVTIPSLGRRRPWIILAQGMMAVTVAAMLLIPDLTANLDVLVWMIFAHTVFNALQDVAVDALAVDLLDDDERGRANGFMYASKYAGGILGAYGLGYVIDWFSFETALIVQASILLAIMMVPLLVRERSGPPAPRPAFGPLLRSIGTAFTLRSAVLVGFLMLSYQLAGGILTAIGPVLFVRTHGWFLTSFGPVLFVNAGWDAGEFRMMTGLFGLLSGLAGATVGGLIAEKVGSRRLAALGCAALATLWTVFGLCHGAWGNHLFVWTVALTEGFCIAVVTVSLFALCMAVSWPRIAAVQFTAYMALANFSTTLGFKLAGPAEDALEYWGIYLLAAALQLAVIAWLPLIDPGQTRRTLPLPDGTRPRRLGIAGGVGLLVIFVALLVVFVFRPLFR